MKAEFSAEDIMLHCASSFVRLDYSRMSSPTLDCVYIQDLNSMTRLGPQLSQTMKGDRFDFVPAWSRLRDLTTTSETVSV